MSATRYTLHATHATRSRGFTLVETLLALALLSAAVLAPLGIASKSLSAVTTGKNRIIAISLARDAIEYVRNVRDENRLYNQTLPPPVTPRNWLDRIDRCRPVTGVSFGCVIDTLVSLPHDIKKITTGANEGPLQYYIPTGVYGYRQGGPLSDWTDSQFMRRVTLVDLVVDRQIRVTATVTWPVAFGLGTKSVVLTEQLTNW